MIYGYARVSTKGQAKDGNSLENQISLLKSNGATKIFEESFTGTKKDRPEFSKLLSLLKEGDTLVVTKLDRFARNTINGIEVIQDLLNRNIKIHVLNMGMIDSTPTGKLIVTVLFAFAEFERNMIIERTQEGKEIAKERDDYHEGRPQIKIDDFKKYYDKTEKGLISVTECCKQLNISRSTWYNKVKELNS